MWGAGPRWWVRWEQPRPLNTVTHREEGGESGYEEVTAVDGTEVTATCWSREGTFVLDCRSDRVGGDPSEQRDNTSLRQPPVVTQGTAVSGTFTLASVKLGVSMLAR